MSSKAACAVVNSQFSCASSFRQPTDEMFRTTWCTTAMTFNFFDQRVENTPRRRPSRGASPNPSNCLSKLIWKRIAQPQACAINSKASHTIATCPGDLSVGLAQPHLCTPPERACHTYSCPKLLRTHPHAHMQRHMHPHIPFLGGDINTAAASEGATIATLFLIKAYG